MIVLTAILVLALIVAALMYNGLVARRNAVENAFSSVDVMLKKRYDLIPNLVATVKGYMQHEAGLLKQVTELRAKALSSGPPSAQTMDLNNQLTRALGGIMVAVENYPQLKANENFLRLQGALNEIEEQISAARRAFNAAVTAYNNSVEMFPSSVMAQMMGYTKRKWFEAPEGGRAPVKVEDFHS